MQSYNQGYGAPPGYYTGSMPMPMPMPMPMGMPQGYYPPPSDQNAWSSQNQTQAKTPAKNNGNRQRKVQEPVSDVQMTDQEDDDQVMSQNTAKFDLKSYAGNTSVHDKAAVFAIAQFTTKEILTKKLKHFPLSMNFADVSYGPTSDPFFCEVLNSMLAFTHALCAQGYEVKLPNEIPRATKVSPNDDCPDVVFQNGSCFVIVDFKVGYGLDHVSIKTLQQYENALRKTRKNCDVASLFLLPSANCIIPLPCATQCLKLLDNSFGDKSDLVQHEVITAITGNMYAVIEIDPSKKSDGREFMANLLNHNKGLLDVLRETEKKYSGNDNAQNLDARMYYTAGAGVGGQTKKGQDQGQGFTKQSQKEAQMQAQMQGQLQQTRGLKDKVQAKNTQTQSLASTGKSLRNPTDNTSLSQISPQDVPRSGAQKVIGNRPALSKGGNLGSENSQGNTLGSNTNNAPNNNRGGVNSRMMKAFDQEEEQQELGNFHDEDDEGHDLEHENGDNYEDEQYGEDHFDEDEEIDEDHDDQDDPKKQFDGNNQPQNLSMRTAAPYKKPSWN